MIMEIYGRILEFLSSPKKRKVCILILLVSILIIIAMFNCSAPLPYDSPRIMICEKCGYRQQLRLAEKLKCPKCAKEMGYLWKCMTCRYEFQYSPPKIKRLYANEEEFRLAKINSCRCPNCDSVETFIVTILNMPDKKPEAPK